MDNCHLLMIKVSVAPPFWSEVRPSSDLKVPLFNFFPQNMAEPANQNIIQIYPRPHSDAATFKIRYSDCDKGKTGKQNALM